eukprot:TRINITY_DN10445_c0_g1_i1.p1 TRINITY_DN10445_c0_g1~~TRINITY_DN10445_c0_g1_i1.p1  ORF type:complete len:316 (-),score=47.80 TRINITY_DN10445_c0_g1_i1:133-1080(-)
MRPPPGSHRSRIMAHITGRPSGITEADWVSRCTRLGVPRPEAIEMFRALDSDGNGILESAEAAAAVQELQQIEAMRQQCLPAITPTESDLGSGAVVGYKRYAKYLPGAMANFFHGDMLSPFVTYSVRLRDTAAIFGGKWQHWNVQYPAAQQIFGKKPSCMAVRATVHMIHDVLHLPLPMETTSGTLRTGQDLLQLLKFGMPNGHPIRYTYVIMDDKMVFSETSKLFLKDKYSKHAVHARASQLVRYSGEFCIDYERQGTPIVIDNDSGTYAPDPQDLPKVSEVLQHTFPGLVVYACQRDDPYVKGLKERIKALER